MKRALLILAIGAAGCSANHSDIDSNVAAQAQALAIPAPYGTPNDKTSGWDRSYVDLMVADTWSTCSFLQGSDQPINHILVQPGDQYLDQLLTSMTRLSAYWVAHQSSDAGVTTQAAQQQWINYRNDPAYNRNRETNEGQGAGLLRRDLRQYTLTLSDPKYAAAQVQASQSVALAAMNACIAQGVRSLALGSDIMSLSEADQIQALEVVRERAQIAMLQYAAILNAISAPLDEAFVGPTATTFQQLAFLQQWAATTPNRGDYFNAWMSDFAAVVQLHLTVTQELSELFVRSAAARSARGGQASNAADEQWGAGSWRQRILALLYGGDPLTVAADHSTPWTNMVGRTAPGVALDTAVRPPDPWPTPTELPYFSIDTKDPGVMQLLSLARRADALRVANNADGSADIETSAEELYRATEAQLRTEQCSTLVNGNCKTYADTDVPAWAGTAIDAYLLFSNFGITRDHARLAVKYLDQYAPSQGISSVHPIGALRVANGWRVIPRDTVDAVRMLDEISPLFERYGPYRIPATVDPNVERSHPETTTAGVNYRIGDDQGLAAGGLYAESMRVYGAMPALSAVRDVLARVAASSRAPAELVTAVNNVGAALSATVNAAIGARAARLAPLEQVLNYDWSNSGVQFGRLAYERLQKVRIQRSPVATLAGWAVDADYDPVNDSFFGDAAATYDLLAVKNSPAAYGLALSKLGRGFDGKSFDDLANDTMSGNTVIVTGVSPASGKLHVEIFLKAEALSNSPPPTWTFVLRKTLGGNISYRPLTGAIPLYAWQFNHTASARASELAPIYSYSFAHGGRLGTIATQAWSVQPSNPSHPRYDGFGLPFTWVPAADATAFGSQPGDSVMTYFLRNAKQAAADATDAVRAAINSTQQQQQATLDQQAAQARSGLVLQQEAEGLCGAAGQSAGASCVPAVQQTSLSVSWTPLALTVTQSDGTSVAVWAGVDPATYCGQTPDPTDQSALTQLRQLDCLSRKRILAATQNVPVSAPVAAELSASSAPTFEAYSGGQIQAALVDQWSALRRVQNTALQIENTKVATAQRILAGAATLTQLQASLDAVSAQLSGLQGQQAIIAQKLVDTGQSARKQCFAMATIGYRLYNERYDQNNFYPAEGQAGFDKDPSAYLDTEANAVAGQNWNEVTEFSNAQAACKSARAALDDARLQAAQANIMIVVQGHQVSAAEATLDAARGNSLAEMTDGLGNILRSGGELDTALADAAKTLAQISQLQTQSQLAVARAQLENSLAAQGAQLSLGLYRQYNQYDWWRARALLDGARRYAVAARRAIETSYVVDLSTLTAPEPFVAAPSSWAADVYRFDLSLPSAVGLSTGTTIGGAQYPNAVLDYVGNLERFVQGFAVARPMTAAVDNQIVSIAGPGATIVVNGNPIADPARSAWSVLCPAATLCASATSPAWCPVSTTVPVASTCQLSASSGGTPQYVAPLKAHVIFYLDPWGRLLNKNTFPPLNDRANARWGRMMVNLEGSGIVDCTVAANPTECLATSHYLSYDLSQVGPTMAFGATRDWILLDVPTIQIEQGKAAAVGQILDVQQNAWGQPFVEADARSEWIGRPLNGTYTIELASAPGVSFDSVTSVQILNAQSYSALQP
jgi:hypothetical protein